MRVKRYIVDTMPEAMQHIRTDLGADAVILSTKDIKVGGFLGMFSRRKIEVIAAAEQEEKKKTVSSSKPRPAASAVAGGAVPQAYKKAASLNAGQQQGGAAIATAPPEESLPKRDEEYERFASALHQAAAAQLEPDPSSVEERQRVAEEAGPSRIGKERKVPEARDDKRPSAASELSITEQNLLAELREMKEWMAKLSRQNLEAQQLPEPMQRIRDQLLKQEVSAKLAERWMDAAIDAWNASGKNLDDQQLQDIIRQQAASFLADRFGEVCGRIRASCTLRDLPVSGKRQRLPKLRPSSCSSFIAR